MHESDMVNASVESIVLTVVQDAMHLQRQTALRAMAHSSL